MSPLVKRLSWALALSLGLNLFLLGFGSARWFRREPVAESRLSRGRPGPRFGGPPTPELRAQHEALRAARQKVAAALAAEPYEAQRLAGALAELRELTSRGQTLLHERLLERAATMSLEERRELGESRFVRRGRWRGE